MLSRGIGGGSMVSLSPSCRFILLWASGLCWTCQSSRPSNTTRFLWSASEKLGAGCGGRLFPSLGKAESWKFSSASFVLSRGENQWNHQPKPPPLFFPGCLDYAEAIRAPRLARQEPVLWETPWKSRGTGHVNLPFLSPG